MNAYTRDVVAVAAFSIGIAILKFNTPTLPSAPVTAPGTERAHTKPMGSVSSKVHAKMAGPSGGNVDDVIDDLISSNSVVIFSKSYCPYCHMAKDAIKDAGKGVPGFPGAAVVELDRRGDGSTIQRAIAARTGRSTVPSVYVAGNSIGGGQETTALNKKGKLVDLLRAAVAKAADAAPVDKEVEAEVETEVVIEAPALTADSDFDAYISDVVAK